MIKKILLFTLLIISISCATKSKVVENKNEKPFDELENAGTFTGQKRPDWMSMNGISEIKELYPGKVPFRAELTGANVNLLRRRANTTTLNAQVSQVVSTAIAQSAYDMLGGSESSVDVDSFASSISAASKAQFSGFTQEGEWWVKIKWKKDGKEEYRYYVLYLIDQDRFNRILSGTIRDASKVINEVGDNIAQALEDNIESVNKAYEATSLE